MPEQRDRDFRSADKMVRAPFAAKRLRFVKDWGEFKAGDFRVTESPTTVHFLVGVYKVAVVDEPLPVSRLTRWAESKTETQNKIKED